MVILNKKISSKNVFSFFIAIIALGILMFITKILYHSNKSEPLKQSEKFINEAKADIVGGYSGDGSSCGDSGCGSDGSGGGEGGGCGDGCGCF